VASTTTRERALALLLPRATACAAGAPALLPAGVAPGRPLAVTHRGAAGDAFPENTLEALRHALRAGARGVEVDVSFTRDGRLVLWHDEDPRTAGATARRLGAAPGPYRPLVPVDARRPLPELRWAEARLALGYTRGDGKRLPFAVPLLEEALAVVRAQPAVRLVVLDLKTAAGPATGAAYAPALRRALEGSGLEPERLLLLHRDPLVVRHLQRALGGTWALAHDGGGGGPASALASAQALGTPVVSLARAPCGPGAWAALVASVRGARAGIEAEVQAGLPRRRLLVWTLDREAELREAIALGVDLIVTDEPARLEALLAPGPP
jgi:glycerophosphoryl diester phosphodiesterase